MKFVSIIWLFLVPLAGNAQENECVTIIEKSADNELLFDDSNPLSFVRIVDQSRFQLEAMSRKTFEAIDKLTTNEHFSFRLGLQSDVPIQTLKGEDSLCNCGGNLCYVYTPTDTFYYDLTNISRFILREVVIFDSLTKTSSYQIATIDFVKRFPWSDQYFVTASLNYQAFLKYKGYHVDIGLDWKDVFTWNNSLEETFQVMKRIAISNRDARPGKKQDSRVKVLECDGVHDYMGDEPPNLTYRINSSNQKYNASFNCPNLYSLTHELDSNQLLYSIKTSYARPVDIGCGDTMINEMYYYKYPEYYWVMKDSVKTIFTYKAKNLSVDKLQLESVSFIGQMDNQPCLLMRLILNEPRTSERNELDALMSQLDTSTASFFNHSIDYNETLKQALILNSKPIDSSNKEEWDQFKKEVFQE